MDYDEIDFGIRGAVQLLRWNGFETTDSGDGSKEAYMECALEYPHVFILGDPERIVEDCHRLRDLFLDAAVQATYNPDDELLILSVRWPEKTASEVAMTYPFSTGVYE